MELHPPGVAAHPEGLDSAGVVGGQQRAVRRQPGDLGPVPLKPVDRLWD